MRLRIKKKLKENKQDILNKICIYVYILSLSHLRCVHVYVRLVYRYNTQKNTEKADQRTGVYIEYVLEELYKYHQDLGDGADTEHVHGDSHIHRRACNVNRKYS